MRWWIAAVLLLAAPAFAGESQSPAIARERIVFSTDYGDLVFALYPDVAPRHVAQLVKLARLGAYDTTRAFRVVPHFIVQFSDVKNRAAPLTREQYEADQKIPGEFSATLRHVKGVLSMARWDDPDSATSSFSVLLGDAPHLDGKYTIFGHLESGVTTINRILGVPRDGETPQVDIVVRRATVVDDIEAYYATRPRDASDEIGIPIPQAIGAGQSTNVGGAQSQDEVLRWIAFPVLAMIAMSITGFFLFERLSKRQLLSLHMLSALFGAFVLFVIAVPLGHRQPWLAVAIFIALPLLFKFMNRFESAR